MSSTFPLALALLLFPFMHLIVARDTLNARADCSKSYTICQPKGASTQDEPPVGSALSPLFVDIVNTVDSNHNHKREAREDHAIGPRVSTGSLCCKKVRHKPTTTDTDRLAGADGTQCLLLQDYNLPFCYVSTSSDHSFHSSLTKLGQLHDQLFPARRQLWADSLRQLHLLGWSYSEPHQRQLYS